MSAVYSYDIAECATDTIGAVLVKKFSTLLILVSVLSVLWTADNVITVVQRGGPASPMIWDLGVLAFLFPFLAAWRPRIACWIGLSVAVFEMLLSILLFCGIFISYVNPKGINIRLFGIPLGLCESLGANFLYCLVRFVVFGAVGVVLLIENVKRSSFGER